MNIVFDLGGVVVRWDPDALVAKLIADPAVRNVVRTRIISDPDWLDLDRGIVTPDEAIARAVERTGLPLDVVSEFLYRVPAELTPIPETVDLLHRLNARGYRLFCLSNMPEFSMTHLERSHAFWHVFTGKVISSRIQLCKPDPAIYQHLLDTHALDAAQTVFIDDVQANLTAAAAFGIKTIRFIDAAQCERELLTLGVHASAPSR